MSHGSGLTLRGAAALAAALTFSAAPGAAQAQQQDDTPVGRMFAQAQQQRQATANPVPLYNTGGASRYSTPDGAVRFVLDRSGGRVALVRFEGDPEVHVLRPVAAQGGDEIYRTEDGDVALRVTRHGGITVYTRNNRTGAPASEEARVEPLTPEAIAVAAMRQRMRELQALAARSVGQPVAFELPAQMALRDTGVVMDAAERAAQGLADAPLTNVRRVTITIGTRPGAALRGEQLIVQVAPQLGYAGRPSSNAIRNVVTGAVQGPEQ